MNNTPKVKTVAEILEDYTVLDNPYLAFYGFGRFFIEILRGDSLYIGSIKVSMLLSAILFIIGVVIIILSFVYNKKRQNNEQKQNS